MTSTTHNLDRLAAKYSQNIVQNLARSSKAAEIENSIMKSLGVLQENGVYAYCLYLLAKEKRHGTVILGETLNLLSDIHFSKYNQDINNTDEILKYVLDNVTNDLERLLLAKETIEQMLIYARYNAKACE